MGTPDPVHRLSAQANACARAVPVPGLAALMDTGTGRGVLRREPIERMEETDLTEGPQLARALGLWQLTALGLGGITGAGIFAFAGAVAQGTAGPVVGLGVSSDTPTGGRN